MFVKVNGGLRTKNKSIVLTIYSSAFSRYLLKNRIKEIGIKFFDKKVEIFPGSEKRVIFERVKEDHPLCILYVSKLISKKVKEELISTKKQKQIKVIIRKFIDRGELIKYNNRIAYREPKKEKINIPSSELIKVSCHISCYRQNDKMWYRFNVRHRILEEIAVREEKIRIERVGNKFYILKDKRGIEFKLYKNYKGHPLTYISISPSLLTKKEKEIFRKKRCISFKAFLSSIDFNLDISRFFINKEERELAYALLKTRVKIRIPEMRKREADILIQENKSQIEITKVMPRINKKNKNTPHTEGVHITAKLCEGFLRIKKKKVNTFFVVFHEEWMKYKWVRNLCEMVKPKVISIPTNFVGDWAKKVAEKIKGVLENDG